MNNSIKKGVVVAVILLFVSVSVVPSTGTNVVEKKSTMPTFYDGNTLYVGGNGTGNYSKIQDAIDDANDGDTVFVYDDSAPYYENVVVNKSINLIGENRDTTVIDGGGSGDVVWVKADWVNISGFTIRNGNDGIYTDSNCNTITGDNIISNEDDGIKLRESDFNIITGNNISENRGDGVYITDSYKNNLSLNTINNNNAYGIRLSESLNGSVFKNTILHNRYSGIVIGLSSNIIIEKNAISESFYDDYNGEGIVLIDSWNISISYNYLSDNINGILIINSSWNHIFHNIITNNSRRGIYFWAFPSHYNMIERNDITNNNCGVLLKDSSYNEIIYNNFNGNKKHAKFVGCRNAWNSNYWGRIRLLPKPIFGRLGMHGLAYNIPWVQFDWHPAQEPYDIGV